MAQIRLRNRSGKTLRAGDLVRYHPTDKRAVVLSDLLTAPIIGAVTNTVTNGGLVVVDTGSRGGGNGGEYDLTKAKIEAEFVGLITTHTHPAQSIAETFETVAKNLKGFPYTMSYEGGALSAIAYDIGAGDTIIKTLNYTEGVLTSIVLSGDVPDGVALTKTLHYTDNVLTSVTYA